MISDWIQVRTELGRDPKVTRILDSVRKTLATYVLRLSPDDLLSGVTSRVTVPVTDLVTSAALRDIVLATLVRVWGTANHFVREETIPGVGVEWVDEVAQIAGFGRAMQKVGWLELTENGLRFPNFNEWNRPKTNALRSSGAVRKERQRLRSWLSSHDASHADWDAKSTRLSLIESRLAERDTPRDAGRDGHVPVTPLRKGKDSLISERESSASAPEQHELALQADAIASAYPRQDDPIGVRSLILDELRRGTEATAMREAVQICAGHIRRAPGGSSNRYVPNARTFFVESQWRSPEAFEARWQMPQPEPGKHRNGHREVSTIHTAATLKEL